MENMTNNTWAIFEDNQQFSKEEIEYLINLAAEDEDDVYIDLPELTLKMKIENKIKDIIQKIKKVFSKKDDPFIDDSFLNDLEELPFT